MTAETADNRTGRPDRPEASRRVRRKALAAAGGVCLVLTALAAPSRAGIHRVVLRAGPRPVDWDSVKGPDGVPASILLYPAGSARPGEAQGKVEILLFEGTVAPEKLASARPKHLWPFPQKDLATYRAPLDEGTGYRMNLPWGAETPTSDQVTLAARHRGADGTVVYSAPVLLAMAPYDKGPAVTGRFTIVLMTFPGANHRKLALYYELQTRRFTGWKDVYVTHHDDHSVLFRGHYPSIDAAGPALKEAKQYTAQATGIRPFTKALIVPLPSPPPGPAEWDARNADGAYTVLIATFYDVPEENYVGRRKFAVMYCRQLRQEGHEAYYHHGPAHSAVVIGTFDRSVVQPASQPGAPARPAVVDPRVQSILNKFPHLAVNGRMEYKVYRNPTTGQVTKIPVRSRLIQKPTK